MTSIHKEPKKIKLLPEILLILLILLGIMAAFVLGRLSALQNAPKTAFSIEKAQCPIPAGISANLVDSGDTAQTTPTVDSGQGAFVASKNGTKFYPANCSYADRIGDANKIWFDTETDAVEAGYEQSSQCTS